MVRAFEGRFANQLTALTDAGVQRMYGRHFGGGGVVQCGQQPG